MRNVAKPHAWTGEEAYEEGERLLELRDLLFGKGVGLSQALLSAIKFVDQGWEPSTLSAAGFMGKLVAGEETDHVGVCRGDEGVFGRGLGGLGCRR
jgi:hypothetical protein